MRERKSSVLWRLARVGPALLVLAAIGCAESRLVRSPPPPIFGLRLAARPAPAAQATFTRTLPRYGEAPALWQPSGTERSWQYIVVHHSATTSGSAARFDAVHRAKGWDELGYHFVIGNGTGSGDGEVEVGGRWFKQKHGAHCKVAGHPEYNDVGIGICLVGNFNETHPSDAQMESLSRLVRYLMSRYDVPQGRVYGHGQLKATDCPGRLFDFADLRRRIGR
jgi:hypothetical protein